MIVYLQKNYADEDGNESHWLRNGLLATGALVGGHFAAKGGLMGRHMQKFAGNMHTKMGNALGLREMAESGRRSAGTAEAMLKNNVTGRGNAAWEEAYKKANPNASLEGMTEEAKNKVLGKFREQQIGTAMKSGEGVEQISSNLIKSPATTPAPVKTTTPATPPTPPAAGAGNSSGKMTPEQIAQKKAEAKSKIAMNRKITADRQASAQAAADAGKISKIENGVINKQQVGVEGRTQEEIEEINKRHVAETLKKQAANKEQSLIQQNNLKSQLQAKRAAAQEAAKNGWVETTGKEFMGPTLPNFG